jgi:hypothetical protein
MQCEVWFEIDANRKGLGAGPILRARSHPKVTGTAALYILLYYKVSTILLSATNPVAHTDYTPWVQLSSPISAQAGTSIKPSSARKTA